MHLRRRGKIVYRMEQFRQNIGRCYLESLRVLLLGVLVLLCVLGRVSGVS